MFADTRALLAPALVERLVLLINHVLASEPHACRRLLPHQGRVLRVVLSDWPGLLPAPPALAFRITPAGLLEWAPEAELADLLVRVPAGNPLALAASVLAQAMAGAGAGAGQVPDAAGNPAGGSAGSTAGLALDIEGDARLATDIDWLAKNLRWDLAADLERLFGPIAAHQLTRWGRALARALALARGLGPGVGPGVGRNGLASGFGPRPR